MRSPIKTICLFIGLSILFGIESPPEPIIKEFIPAGRIEALIDGTEGKNLILPYFNIEGLKDISPNAIQLEPSLSLKGKLSAKYMTEILGVDSIAIVAPSTPEGRQCVDAFLKVLDQKEITPILVEWYSPKSQNMKP